MGGDKAVIEKVPSPLFYVQPPADDEIDLVDLWITLLAYKKVFLISTLSMITLGLVGVTLLHEERYTIRSVVELDDMKIGGKSIQIETPQAVIERFKLTVLPRLSKSDSDEASANSVELTRISNPPGTRLVVVENTITQSQAETYAEYHRRFLAEILGDLERKKQFVVNRLQSEIALAANKISELRAKINFLDKELEERQLTIQNEGDLPKRLLQSLEDEFDFKKDLVKKEIEQISAQITEYEYELKYAGPMAIVEGAVSDKPVGISRLISYVMVVLVSLIIAIFVTLGAIFIKKVNQRKASEA